MSSHSDTFSVSGSSPTVVETDFSVENHGSIFLLRPLSTMARNWVEEHIRENNGFQPYYPTVVVEHRYIHEIVAGIRADGLSLEVQ